MRYFLGTIVQFLFIWTTHLQTSGASEDTVFFRGVLVQNQDNIEMHKPSRIWMNIREGLYSNFSSVDKPIKIGAPTTILIYLNDLHTKRDIAVEECWAYNEPVYDKSSVKLQLISNRSEFQKNNKKSVLINPWTKAINVDSHNVTTVLYTNITSFKFPEKEYVYVACTVKLCSDLCEANNKPASLKYTSYGRESQPSLIQESAKFLFGKLKPSVLEGATTPIYPHNDCNLKSKKFLCLLMKPHCYYGSKDPQCNTKPPTHCPPGSQDPHCNPNHPPHCYPGSQDPQCNNHYPPNCYPGSQNPQCNNNNNPPNCYPGSQNPQCNNNPPNCYPGSQNPLCNNNPPNCYPGSQNPQCNNNNPPNCYPGSQNPQCNNNPPNCYPGSQNPLCNNNPPNCYPGSQNPLCNNNPPNCYPGSQNPQCNNNHPPHCPPGSQAPECANPPPPNCGPGSSEPHCVFSALSYCYPGSKNPNCKPTTPPQCYPGSQHPECRSTNPPLRCYPGSTEPQCNLDSPQHCHPGSTNPECSPILSTTDKPICLFGHLCIPTKPPFLYNKPIIPLHCIFGSSDPKCPQIKDKDIIKVSEKVIKTNNSTLVDTTESSPPKNYTRCSSGKLDPRCAVEADKNTLTEPTVTTAPLNCTKNLFDSKCILETSTVTKLEYNPFLPPNCYPGTKDPRCTQSTTHKSDDSFINQTTVNPLKPPNCYPGANDPRCSTSTVQKSDNSLTTQAAFNPLKPPNCYPDSKDPRCVLLKSTTVAQ